MPADVIEVDFKSNRLRGLSLSERTDELLEEADELLEGVQVQIDGISEGLSRIERREQWFEEQWNLACRQVGSLKSALHRERARNFPFTDEQVLGALTAVHDRAPVRATAIARHLYGQEPTHSARVRVGLSLSRLAAAGRVRVAVPPDWHRTTLWEPVEVDDA